MRSPEETVEKIRTRYRARWREWLEDPAAGPFSFPLGAPKADEIIRDEVGVRSWLLEWRAWAMAHPQVTLRRTQVRVPFGTQEVCTHVDIPDVTSLVSLLADDADHWRHARHRYELLTDDGAIGARVRRELRRIMELDDYDFSLLLQVRTWFVKNPRSGMTIRQVPVEGLHTKWLAKHRALVIATLDLAAADDGEIADDGEVAPETLDALGLKPLPSHVDVILVDPEDRRRIAGIRHLRAPIEEIAALPLAPAAVLVVENKESALPIRDREGLVVIHSLGNFLDTLVALPWIPADVLYWGDLDRAGFTLLSRARTRVPTLRSVMMDRATLQLHGHLANIDPTMRVDPPDATLTPEEQRTLETLQAGAAPRRLEQERIPWHEARAALERALRASS
ncbi:Wadjet anti-phage system protein JetD domain-containing protein [Microbacterium luticocti]|uniref:Wadjet anti-phage system protein JetD domain-containing protein n=1 Tax=Microbacterium luticocti TaxID=451764 RepID=UPI0006859D33|nr:Wadjet anti-phage system protein JetD domain-containing protein [Microbacterium luticocti]